jgi:mutator protein MutT
MDRTYPARPIPGVGVIVVNGGKVLIIKRAFEPSKGKWSIPGGVVELGERVRDAAKREVREETGLDIEIKELVTVVDTIVSDADGKIRFHFVLIDFWAELTGGTVKLSGECLEAAWITENDLNSYDLTAGARKAIERAFERVQK